LPLAYTLRACQIWSRILVRLASPLGRRHQNEIGGAVHAIAMMVEVLLDVLLTLQASEADRSVFEVSRKEGEIISFAAFDIDKRVTALRDALDWPTATVVKIGGNRCA